MQAFQSGEHYPLHVLHFKTNSIPINSHEHMVYNCICSIVNLMYSKSNVNIQQDRYLLTWATGIIIILKNFWVGAVRPPLLFVKKRPPPTLQISLDSKTLTSDRHKVVRCPSTPGRICPAPFVSRHDSAT